MVETAPAPAAAERPWHALSGAEVAAALEVDPAQGLTPVQTLSTLPADFQGPNTTAEVKVHPSGKFVWVSNRGHDSLAGFAIDGAGNLVLAAVRVPPAVFLWTTVVTLAVIGGRSLAAMSTLRAGGDAVARMAGGVPVARDTA